MTTNSLKEQIDKENSRSIEIKGGIHTGLFIKDELRMRDDNIHREIYLFCDIKNNNNSLICSIIVLF